MEEEEGRASYTSVPASNFCTEDVLHEEEAKAKQRATEEEVEECAAGIEALF